MKNKRNYVTIFCFLAILFSTQAMSNSQIQEDFAYAFGSAERLDSGRILLLSPEEMAATEGQFLGWIVRIGRPAIKKVINILKLLRVEAKSGGQGHKVGVWIRYPKYQAVDGHAALWYLTGRHDLAEMLDRLTGRWFCPFYTLLYII